MKKSHIGDKSLTMTNHVVLAQSQALFDSILSDLRLLLKYSEIIILSFYQCVGRWNVAFPIAFSASL